MALAPEGRAGIGIPLRTERQEDEVTRGGMAACAVLPNRYPFVMIDRILALEPGHWAVALKNVTLEDPFVDEEGRWPFVLLLEAMAQTAGIAASASRRAGTAGALARLTRFRCRRAVAAGDQLFVVTRIVRRFGPLVKAHAVVRAGEVRCAAAELVLHLGAEGAAPE